jgi:uncharacterized protein
MLHSYAFSNHRSFLERVEVSLRLTEKDSVNGWDVISPLTRQRLTTALAVMGPNASGKTALLQPLAFVAWFIRGSFGAAPDDEIPVIPHFQGTDLPSDYEVVTDGVEEGTLLRYSLSATRAHVISESLERKYRRGVWGPIFRRERTPEGKYKIEQDGFGMDQTQAENVRRNVSLISWAAQFGVLFAQRLTQFVFTTNVNITGRTSWPHNDDMGAGVTRFFAENEAMRVRMRDIVTKWDLGLSDVEFQQIENISLSGEKKKDWLALGIHRDQNGNRFVLPFGYESSGTKAAYLLLGVFLPVLERGGVIAYDELETDLHPHMLEPLLDLFSNAETNPHDAQIIFTCHAVEVLRLLQKSQVILVEKDGLESHAWRLDSMEGVRIDDNRVAKYSAGAYGAVPRL